MGKQGSFIGDVVSRRDHFASIADVSWIRKESSDMVTLITGVNHPPEPMSDAQKATFYVRAEIAWRWKFANLMLKGEE